MLCFIENKIDLVVKMTFRTITDKKKMACVVSSEKEASTDEIKNCLEKEFRWIYNIVTLEDGAVKKSLKQVVEMADYSRMMIQRELDRLQEKKSPDGKTRRRIELLEELIEYSTRYSNLVKEQMDNCSPRIKEGLKMFEVAVLKAIGKYKSEGY